MEPQRPDPFEGLRDALGSDETRDVRRRLRVPAAALALGAAIVAFTWWRPEPSTTPVDDPQPLEAAAPEGTAPLVARVWPDEAVEVAGTEVRTGGHRWSVGEPGDIVAVGDWDCDGAPTPAVVRPSLSRLYLFDGWATMEQVETASPGPDVPAGAVALEATACGRATVRTADGATVDVITGGDR